MNYIISYLEELYNDFSEMLNMDDDEIDQFTFFISIFVL